MIRPIASRLLALLLALGATVLAPVGGVPGFGATCASAAGEIRVTVVVEQPSSGPSVVCVSVPEGSTGADVLVARAEALGVPAPRWDPSGLLCAIDGVPAAPECGQRTSSGYRYWSYWNGDRGTWSYASVGPATRRVAAGAVEGWHFVEGAGRPSDPPPATAPDHRATCGAPDVPSSPLPPPAPPDAGPAPAPDPRASAPGGGAAGGGGSSGTDPGTTLGPPAGTGAPGPTSTVAPDPGGEVPAAAAADPTAPDTTGGAPAPSSGATATADGGDEAALAPEVVPASSSRQGGGGPPTATLVGVVLVAAIGAATVVRARRQGSAA